MEVLSIKPSHKTPIYEIFQTSRLTKGHIHDPQAFHCDQPRDTGSTHQRLASGRISQVAFFGIPWNKVLKDVLSEINWILLGYIGYIILRYPSSMRSSMLLHLDDPAIVTGSKLGPGQRNVATSWFAQDIWTYSKKYSWLVVEPTPLKNMKVSWDDYSQYMEQ